MKQTALDKKFDKIRAMEEAGQLKPAKGSRALRKLMANRLAMVGLVIFSVILLMSIFAPLITEHDPQKINLRAMLKPPSWDHLLGTDRTGRDVFARILYGGRISILVGLGSALMAAVIGVGIGCYTGYKGGWIDTLALRISEIFMSFPQIILVLLLVSIAGQSLMNLIIIFVLTGWAPMYRMARAKMLSLREEEYVQALRSFGVPTVKICYKHILPNALGPIMVNITLSTAMFILAEAGLSFLGLGVPLSVPTWGNILNVAQDLRVLQNNWWLWLPVGSVISLFVLSVNFIGDGLRDSTDPTLQG
ncbi:Stage 0 sporulation protein KC [Thalassovita autumnalis]|uniref:Stage 0 sporulation protein KC n=1 Tax=Thalassovita autumnalis TaxID=2072972 RepID=A0A0N7LVE0_9RHOB|nr:ABC transporter permease [Thalassovita autumnalis]CUH66034.1 Stage 0 sporulation protein KC [Thalassovita autumnalis]CUH72502.1 Stage 0 sporulation protein KC [Thalassovita autumnalis]